MQQHRSKSVFSILQRTFGIEGTWIWIASVIVIFILTCLVLRTAMQRGNQSMAFALTGQSSCLVSPFSWYHHFVWLIPLSIVLFLKVNEWIAQRVTTFWGRQLAGFGAIAAVVVFHIPFVSYPAWWHMSSRGIDSLSREIPWLGTIWTTLCLLFIVVYAIMGFLPRRESGVRDRAEHITNEGAEDSKASKADGSPFKIEGVEQPTAPPPSPSPPHAHGVDEQR